MKHLLLTLAILLAFPPGIPAVAQNRESIIRLARKECNDSGRKEPSRITIEREVFIESLPIQTFEADTIAIVEYYSRFISFDSAFYEYDTQLRSIHSAYCDVLLPFRLSVRRHLQLIRANLKVNTPWQRYTLPGIDNKAARIMDLYFNKQTRHLIESGEVRLKNTLDNYSEFRIIVFIRNGDNYSVELFRRLGQIIP